MCSVISSPDDNHQLGKCLLGRWWLWQGGGGGGGRPRERGEKSAGTSSGKESGFNNGYQLMEGLMGKRKPNITDSFTEKNSDRMSLDVGASECSLRVL